MEIFFMRSFSSMKFESVERSKISIQRLKKATFKQPSTQKPTNYTFFPNGITTNTNSNHERSSRIRFGSKRRVKTANAFSIIERRFWPFKQKDAYRQARSASRRSRVSKKAGCGQFTQSGARFRVPNRVRRRARVCVINA